MPESKRLTLSGNTDINHDFDIIPVDVDFHPLAAVYVVTRRTGLHAQNCRGMFGLEKGG